MRLEPCSIFDHIPGGNIPNGGSGYRLLHWTATFTPKASTEPSPVLNSIANGSGHPSIRCSFSKTNAERRGRVVVVGHHGEMGRAAWKFHFATQH